ncbi:hypothetical protein [Rhodococcoides fascians]|uniref:hypothetical protein n=1 Tax=Rhodococcoides fascians TaxID=1828 RepID=UPI0006895597|nr:hypothetical protein [Rhodococcus fascians]
MTVDNALRRNKIAGIVASAQREGIERAAKQADPTRPVLVHVSTVLANVNAILAALAGETDINKLRIDAFSMPSMAIAALTTTAQTEPDAPEGTPA